MLYYLNPLYIDGRHTDKRLSKALPLIQTPRSAEMNTISIRFQKMYKNL